VVKSRRRLVRLFVVLSGGEGIGSNGCPTVGRGESWLVASLLERSRERWIRWVRMRGGLISARVDVAVIGRGAMKRNDGRC
jgi:hypothetical protein